MKVLDLYFFRGCTGVVSFPVSACQISRLGAIAVIWRYPGLPLFFPPRGQPGDNRKGNPAPAARQESSERDRSGAAWPRVRGRGGCENPAQGRGRGVTSAARCLPPARTPAGRSPPELTFFNDSTSKPSVSLVSRLTAARVVSSPPKRSHLSAASCSPEAAFFGHLPNKVRTSFGCRGKNRRGVRKRSGRGEMPPARSRGKPAGGLHAEPADDLLFWRLSCDSGCTKRLQNPAARQHQRRLPLL